MVKNKIQDLRIPKFFFCKKKLWGSSTLQNLNIGYRNRYLSPKDQGENCVGSLGVLFNPPPSPPA